MEWKTSTGNVTALCLLSSSRGNEWKDRPSTGNVRALGINVMKERKSLFRECESIGSYSTDTTGRKTNLVQSMWALCLQKTMSGKTMNIGSYTIEAMGEKTSLLHASSGYWVIIPELMGGKARILHAMQFTISYTTEAMGGKTSLLHAMWGH